MKLLLEIEEAIVPVTGPMPAVSLLKTCLRFVRMLFRPTVGMPFFTMTRRGPHSRRCLTNWTPSISKCLIIIWR